MSAAAAALRSSRLSAGVNATTALADFSPALAREISPGKGLNFPHAPSGFTWCVLMRVGLRRCLPACRPHPASLPVHVLMVVGLPAASFILRLAASDLRFGYGYSHQFRQLRFRLLVQAHAGHTSGARTHRTPKAASPRNTAAHAVIFYPLLRLFHSCVGTPHVPSKTTGRMMPERAASFRGEAAFGVRCVLAPL